MSKYGLNFLVTAVVTFFIAVLSFLVGNEVGVPSVPTAIAAGGFSGIAVALSYTFGQLMCGKEFDWKQTVVMLVSGIAFGMLGGVSMTFF